MNQRNMEKGLLQVMVLDLILITVLVAMRKYLTNELKASFTLQTEGAVDFDKNTVPGAWGSGSHSVPNWKTGGNLVFSSLFLFVKDSKSTHLV